jgi:hypothetical protein
LQPSDAYARVDDVTLRLQESERPTPGGDW